MPKDWDFSNRGYGRVILITLVGTLGSMAVALLATAYLTPQMAPGSGWLATELAIVVPLLMSAPTFYFFASKFRELAIAHHELAIIASQDSLTTCLNRGAFITLVDAYLARVADQKRPAEGGLLVVDADRFKSINDRFGHARGDDALSLVAKCIKNALRDTDLLGRIGGDEFAVFLPMAKLAEIKTIANRIRTAVRKADFRPEGALETLSVSVGGAVFEAQVSFTELFGAADEHLYRAKGRGRNRVELGYAFSGGAIDTAPRQRLAG